MKVKKGDRIVLNDGTIVRATEDSKNHQVVLAGDIPGWGMVYGFKSGDDLIVRSFGGDGWELV